MSEKQTLTPRLHDAIYVASRVKHAETWKGWRNVGAPIIASWIDEAGEGDTADFGELWQRIRDEISRSSVLVFYAAGPDDFPFKGALVEVGIALALGKPVFAALENVVLDGRTMRPVGSWLLDRNVTRFDSLGDAMKAVRKMPCTPVSEKSPASPHCSQHGTFEPDCLDCSDALGVARDGEGWRNDKSVLPPMNSTAALPESDADARRFLNALLCKPVDGVTYAEVHRLLWLAVALQERVAQSAIAPSDLTEALSVAFCNMDENGDPVGAQPESSWERGYAAGLRTVYRTLKARGIKLPASTDSGGVQK